MDEQQAESVAVILARMEVKLDHSLTRGDDHETRLRLLEKKLYIVAGIAGAGGGGIGAWLRTILGG